MPIIDDAALHRATPGAGRAIRVLAIGLLLWFLPIAIAALLLGPRHLYVQSGMFFAGMAVVMFVVATIVFVIVRDHLWWPASERGPSGRARIPAAACAFFFALAFGIPLVFHPVSAVVIYYGIAGLVTGTVLSVVFQMAHCVEEASFPQPIEDTGRIESSWAVHQV
jgi:hypothetical protein